MTTALAKQRFINTFCIVGREKAHLDYSCKKLRAAKLTAERLEALDNDPDLAESIEAFSSRFGRMQDTMAAKLFPSFLEAQAESAGTQLETLNRLEKLGLVESVERWLEARALRNRLVHEYVEDEAKFQQDLELAQEYTKMLATCHEIIGEYALSSMQLEPAQLEMEQSQQRGSKH